MSKYLEVTDLPLFFSYVCLQLVVIGFFFRLLVNDLFMVIESVFLIQFSEEARVEITV